MTRTRRYLVVLLAGALLAVAGCSGSGSSPDSGPDAAGGSADASAVPAGMVQVSTELGTVARPEEWKPNDASQGQEASFLIENDSDQVVGQMDVVISSVTPGTPADAVAGAIQASRFPNIPTLRHTEREFADVPGAESGFTTESTYTTADTQQPARSLDRVAVAEDGRYLLVRISSAAPAYDSELFHQIVDTMRLGEATAS
ncbi:hypothetical protein [Nocardioides mesophilus]|uniref:Uncharacterized protein n=1 Tax=Nocardioides mesophilus TaxID=433659 RepID=A0A7G9REY8_9ACTN|nr:hypothetical protein [Nocardioides mesophilus]QNN54163.1 hypothetical protein H9L09_07310 [Nocardioides mesophilus]